MPNYEYKCGHCSYHFETEQRIIEKPLVHCPKCGGKVHRIIFPTGIVFKGSGFHVTDYGQGSKPFKETKKQKENKTSSMQEHKSTSADDNKKAADKKAVEGQS